jgi:hypothetical protein
MNEQTHFGLSSTFFAQQCDAEGSIKLPSVKSEMTVDAQDMVDMFSELGPAECNKLAALLFNDDLVKFALAFKAHMDDF